MAANAPYAIPRKRFKDTTANELESSIVAFIELTGGAVFPIDTMGVLRNGRWTKSGMKKGTPDILSGKPKMINNIGFCQLVGVEIKIGRDKQSEDQKKIESHIVRSRGIYIIAKDWNGFYTQWDAI